MPTEGQVSVDQPFFGEAKEEKMSLNFLVDILFEDTGFHMPITSLWCASFVLSPPRLLAGGDLFLL
jgi:hypothetical protein